MGNIFQILSLVVLICIFCVLCVIAYYLKTIIVGISFIKYNTDVIHLGHRLRFKNDYGDDLDRLHDTYEAEMLDNMIKNYSNE